MCAARERQYTAAAGEIQVPMGGNLFTRDGRWSEEIDIRIGKADAVLRELGRSLATKRELSNTAKLSVFKSFFVPILSYGHESWVMTERVLTQVQAPEMVFLPRLRCDTRTEGRLAVNVLR